MFLVYQGRQINLFHTLATYFVNDILNNLKTQKLFSKGIQFEMIKSHFGNVLSIKLNSKK